MIDGITRHGFERMNERLKRLCENTGLAELSNAWALSPPRERYAALDSEPALMR
jgi:hypothetical protein